MKTFYALLLVTAVGCLSVSAAVAGQRTNLTSAASIKVCGNVTGAKWVMPKTGGKIAGNKYGVTAVGVSCKIARKFAIKLSSAKLPGKIIGHSYPLAGGPTGFNCHANPDANGKVIAGGCQIGPWTAVSHHAFSWGGRP